MSHRDTLAADLYDLLEPSITSIASDPVLMARIRSAQARIEQMPVDSLSLEESCACSVIEDRGTASRSMVLEALRVLSC